MSLVSQPRSYSDSLVRVYATTIVTGLYCTALLVAGLPSLKAFLYGFVSERSNAGVPGSLIVLICLWIVVLFSRPLLLHDKLSDWLGLRNRFDIRDILRPLFTQAGFDISGEADSTLEQHRQALMGATFYKFAPFEAPRIDAQLVRSAADTWSWFWCALEAAFLLLGTGLALVIGQAWVAASGAMLPLLLLVLFMRYQWSECRRLAARQVVAIVSDPMLRQDVQRLITGALERSGISSTTNRSQVDPSSQVNNADIVGPPITSHRRCDVGIMTIKTEEFEAVLKAFAGQKELFVGPKTHRHYNLCTAEAGNGERYRVAIVRQTEQGNGEAQNTARDMIEDLAPRLLLVVGIAGARPTTDFTLGDVVLSIRVNDYTVHAKNPNGEATYALSGGPVERAIAAGIVNLPARKEELGEWFAELPRQPSVDVKNPQMKGPDSWQSDIQDSLLHHFVKKPRAHPKFVDGPVGSSDGLIKDPVPLIQWLTSARNLLAVEMETAGVYRAAEGRTAWLSIRSISDVVGLTREEEWTQYAALCAAAFARAYLRTTPIAPTGSSSSSLTNSDQSGGGTLGPRPSPESPSTSASSADTGQIARRLAELRRVTAALEESDTENRARILEISRSVGEECARASVRCNSKTFLLDEAGDERVYGFLGASEEGVFIASRSSTDDLEDSYNKIPEEDRIYRTSAPDKWSVKWLRLVIESGRLDELLDDLSSHIGVLAGAQRAPRKATKTSRTANDGESAVAHPRRDVNERFDALSRVLGLLLESTKGNPFHWSKDPQHAATVGAQAQTLRTINASIAARTFKLTPLQKKYIIEAAHESLGPLNSLGGAAFDVSAKHGLLWASITKTTTLLARLFPFHPTSDQGNAAQLLVVGQDEFSLYFQELMTQLQQFEDAFTELVKESTADAKSGPTVTSPPIAPIRPAPTPDRSVSSELRTADELEPIGTQQISTQRQTKGTLVVPSIWKLSAVPTGRYALTRAQLHAAVTNSVVSSDGGTGRSFRWPALLRPNNAEVRRRDDGAQHWHHVARGGADNECYDEQLGVHADGTIWFQRAHFWDTDQPFLDLGLCAFDVIVFLKIIIAVGNTLGIPGYDVMLAVQPSRPQMVVTIQTNGLMARQQTRVARANGATRHRAKIRVGPMTAQPDTVQVEHAKHLVDGIANEFELDKDPFERVQPAPPFLEIDGASVSRVVASIK